MGGRGLLVPDRISLPFSKDLLELFGLASTLNEEGVSLLSAISSRAFPEDLRLWKPLGNLMGIEPVFLSNAR